MNGDWNEARFAVNRVHLPYTSKEEIIAGLIGAYKGMAQEINREQGLIYSDDNRSKISNPEPKSDTNFSTTTCDDRLALCDVHDTELVTHCCRKCEVAICQLCRTSVEHKGHRTKKIHIAVNERKEELVTKFLQQEKTKQTTLLKNLSLIEHEKADFKISCDEVVAMIRQRCTYMKDVLDNIANNLVKDVYLRKNDYIQQYLSSQKTIQIELKECEDKLRFLNSLIDSTNYKLFLQEFKSYKTQAKLENGIPSDVCYKEYVDFEHNRHPASALSDIFGTVNFVTATDGGAVTYGNKQQNGRLSCHTKQSFRCEQSNNTESDDDEQEIGPINALSKLNDELWVSCGVSGRQITCVDEDGQTIRSFRFKFKIEDITCNNRGDIFVTVFKDKCIRKLSPKGKVVGCINVPFHPKGIAVCQDGGFLVCLSDRYSTAVSDESRRLVVKYSNDEREEMVYEYDGDKNLFTRPCRVAENINGDICVIDKTSMGSGQVVILDNTGSLKTIYNGSKVRGKKPCSTSVRFSPSDISCDAEGRIFITDSDNHKIHLLNKEGNYIGYFLTNESDFLCPLSVETDHNNQIWVGNEYGEIKMFSCEWQ